MKNRIVSIFICSCLAFLCACGRKETVSTEQEPVVEIEYMTLAESGETTVSKLETPYDELIKYLFLNAEANGDEDIATMAISKDTYVYSKPSETANVLATAKRGASIDIIGILEEGDFYKVVYGGRIAYIKADAITSGIKVATVTQKTNLQTDEIENVDALKKDEKSQTNQNGSQNNTNNNLPLVDDSNDDNQPITPVEPEKPKPPKPKDPTEPQKPVPDQPEPDEPTVPDQPTPDEPTVPDQPTPDEPTVPDQPTPDEPTVPDQPTPDEPTVPDQPTPDEPTVPDQPVPDQPDNPE